MSVPTARETMLEDYRAARHADELAREGRDYGYATERAMHKAEGVRQPVTLRDWLRQAQQPAPSPAERQAVLDALLVDAHARVASAWLAYSEAVAARDAAVADAHAEGMSLRAIAERMFVSHQAVAKILGRSR